MPNSYERPRRAGMGATTMIDFFQPTDPFAGQTQRLVAEAQHGGGDVFEIARTCRVITPGDMASWEGENNHKQKVLLEIDNMK